MFLRFLKLHINIPGPHSKFPATSAGYNSCFLQFQFLALQILWNFFSASPPWNFSNESKIVPNLIKICSILDQVIKTTFNGLNMMLFLTSTGSDWHAVVFAVVFLQSPRRVSTSWDVGPYLLAKKVSGQFLIRRAVKFLLVQGRTRNWLINNFKHHAMLLLSIELWPNNVYLVLKKCHFFFETDFLFNRMVLVSSDLGQMINQNILTSIVSTMWSLDKDQLWLFFVEILNILILELWFEEIPMEHFQFYWRY